MGSEVTEGVQRLRKGYGGYRDVYGVYGDLDRGAVMRSKELY